MKIKVNISIQKENLKEKKIIKVSIYLNIILNNIKNLYFY